MLLLDMCGMIPKQCTSDSKLVMYYTIAIFRMSIVKKWIIAVHREYKCLEKIRILWRQIFEVCWINR